MHIIKPVLCVLALSIGWDVGKAAMAYWDSASTRAEFAQRIASCVLPAADSKFCHLRESTNFEDRRNWKLTCLMLPSEVVCVSTKPGAFK